MNIKECCVQRGRDQEENLPRQLDQQPSPSPKIMGNTHPLPDRVVKVIDYDTSPSDIDWRGLKKDIAARVAAIPAHCLPRWEAGKTLSTARTPTASQYAPHIADFIDIGEIPREDRKERSHEGVSSPVFDSFTAECLATNLEGFVVLIWLNEMFQRVFKDSDARVNEQNRRRTLRCLV